MSEVSVPDAIAEWHRIITEHLANPTGVVDSSIPANERQHRQWYVDTATDLFRFFCEQSPNHPWGKSNVAFIIQTIGILAGVCGATTGNPPSTTDMEGLARIFARALAEGWQESYERSVSDRQRTQ